MQIQSINLLVGGLKYGKKLRSIKNWFTMDRLEIIIAVLGLITIVIGEIVSIVAAVIEKDYFLLSVINYCVILIIMAGFFKKCFFKRLTYYLVKRPLSTKLVFFILGVSSIILSTWFFVAFLLCIPQAIIYGEFSRVEEEEKEKLSVLAFELSEVEEEENSDFDSKFSESKRED